jgi:hypothetical protein
MELVLIWPKQIYLVLVMSLLIFLFTARQFTHASNLDEKWYNLAILPFCFNVGALSFSAILTESWLIQLLFILTVFVLYSYFVTIYHYLIKPKFFKRSMLENLSSYGNFLAVFFTASSVYGLANFLNLSMWLLMLFFVAYIMLVLYQVMWTNNILSAFGLFYLLLLALVLTELAWSASFLPLSFYVLGLVVAVLYYMGIGIVKFHLLGKLNRSIAKSYLTFGFLSILIVLLTARWL